MGRGKSWTPEELDYLQDKWGNMSVGRIAKRLGRTVNAVKLKAGRIGLGDPLLQYDGITVNQLAEALNMSYSTIRYWIQEKGFPAERRLFVIDSRVLVVTYKEFWEWAEQNKRLIDFTRFEENILGPEPEWAKKKRKADSMANIKKTRWSEKDDQLLVSMVNAFRYTYPEVAKRLGRSEAAVNKRLQNLRVNARPISLDNHIRWSEEDTQLLRQWANEGYALETIAERLDRSAFGVREKLGRLGYQFREREEKDERVKETVLN